MIRQIFEGHFPTDSAAQTAVRWIPRAVSFSNVIIFTFGDLQSIDFFFRIGDALQIPVDVLSLFTTLPMLLRNRRC